ncbi:MAG TPA: serine/threonine-protein kinase [Polyangia bacterium]|nr:serine/threonine-protein kinase [Polyangia bacterium]
MSRPKPGDLIADKYQIERFIGQGGMAEVYAGLNIRTGKRVALKWISPALATTKEALARFRREALAAGRINHPNVVTVFDVVEHSSSTWLVMELLEGDPLSEILNRVGYMEPEPAVQLLIPAIRGVAAAHAHGVIHRDLTPDNIFICRSADGKPREAKVLDFGVSKLADETADQVGITGGGHAVGTPAYMAPEQIRGNIRADARTDVYALGVVLYQMLAGRRPFDGQVYSALMIEIVTTDAPRLRSVQPHVPEALEAVVHRAMAREMEQRFPDVKSLLEALEDLVRLDVSNIPNKMSSGNSGRMVFPVAGERGDVSQPGRVVPFTGGAGTEVALAHRRAGITPAALGPMTPPAGSKSLGRVAPKGALATRRWNRWNRAIPIVAALGLVGAVIALALVRARHNLPPEIAVSAAVAASAAASAAARSQPVSPALSELVVVVTPPSAKVVIDGVPVEGNPYTGHYRKDQIHEISASADGYEPKSQGVVLAKDLVVTLALDRKRDSKKTTWAPVPHAVGMRRPPDARRPAKIAAPLVPESDDFEMPAMRPAALAPRPSPAPAPMTVSPAGGRAPIHPIETASPYESK